MNKLKFIFFALMLLFPSLVQAGTAEQYNVSNGVTYTEIVEAGTKPQSIRVMEMNTNDPYTKMEAGIPDPLNQLMKTSKQAQNASAAGHEVVGAMNGSFFSRDPMPLYFVAIGDQLINGGSVETGIDQFVSVPLAFGINTKGKGQIDTYSSVFAYTYNGQVYGAAGHNGKRDPNSVQVYTSNYNGGLTKTNPYGYEVIFSGSNGAFQFGKPLTGKVIGFRPYGELSGAQIPKGGFVLSGHGDAAETLRQMKIGDTVSVSATIDAKWQGAQFMIGSGPMLVQGSKVTLTIDPNSARARERAPRSAVAINKAGDKVAFITVDGRLPGYSTGMTLPEFAAYIQLLGYDRALNMDGGGSTTMLAREPGNFTTTIQNKPSDGVERSVSTFLMMVTTAPKGVPTTISAKKSSDAELAVGESVNIVIQSIMDEYGNPVKTDGTVITSDLGTVSGTTFTATKAGTGWISVKKNSAEIKLPVIVRSVPQNTAVMLDSFETVTWSVPSSGDFAYDGSRSLKVDGTVKPAYPVELNGATAVSMRIYGQADGTQIAGTFKDASGAVRTANFGTVTWNGWRYVVLPVSNWAALTALSSTKPVYIDSLKSVYGNHQEQLYKDVAIGFRAEADIAALVDKAIISGYPNGTFQPQATLTRVQAALMIQRALKLPVANVKDPGFQDVPKSHSAYGSIAAVAEAGIMLGRTADKFDPYVQLTRAEMAAVLSRALKLPESEKNIFPDNYSGTFSYSSVNALAASGITTGFVDGTFRPGEPIKRADFSIFLKRGLDKQNL